jgi:hypothetical protein
MKISTPHLAVAVLAFTSVASVVALAEVITPDWRGPLKSRLVVQTSIALPRFARRVTFVQGRAITRTDLEIREGTPFCVLHLPTGDSEASVLEVGRAFEFTGVEASQDSATQFSVEFGTYLASSRTGGLIDQDTPRLICERNSAGPFTTQNIAGVLGRKAKLEIPDDQNTQ